MPIFRDEREDRVPIEEDVAEHRQELKRLLARSPHRYIEDLELTAHLPDNQTYTIKIRGVREWYLKFADPEGKPDQVGSTGDLSDEELQELAKADGLSEGGGAGETRGVHDVDELEVNVGEWRDRFFRAWNLPPPKPSPEGPVDQEEVIHSRGWRRKGVRAKWARRPSGKNRLLRFLASKLAKDLLKRYPFLERDHRYFFFEREEEGAKAVVFCVRDVSGSMDDAKRKICSVVFLWFITFIQRRYPEYEIVFIGHDTQAHSIPNLHEFLHTTSSGGTHVSSGFAKVEELLAKYPSGEWSHFVLAASDGENSANDDGPCLAAAARLCEIVRLLGFIETEPSQPAIENGKRVGKAPGSADRITDKLLRLAEKISRKNMAVTGLRNREEVQRALGEIIAREVTDDA